MRTILQILLGLLLLPLLLLAQTQQTPVERLAGKWEHPALLEFEQLRVRPFTIHFHPVDRAYASAVAMAIEQGQRRLTEDLTLINFQNSQVVIAFNGEHFYATAGPGSPGWAAAIANAQRRLIVMKSPRWSAVSPNPTATILHEMAHLGVGILTRGGQIPLWLEEGIAVVEAGVPQGFLGDSGLGLSQALHSGGLMHLDDIGQLDGMSGAGVDLAYQQAESAVRYFIERFGRLALIQTLSLVGEGEDFSVAFDKATGGSYYRFESDWRDWLKDNAGLWFLTGLKGWFWVGAILLVSVGVLLRRLRARRILKRWQAEEEAQVAQSLHADFHSEPVAERGNSSDARKIPIDWKMGPATKTTTTPPSSNEDDAR